MIKHLFSFLFAIAILFLFVFAMTVSAASTNQVDKVAKAEKERKTEYQEKKIIIKARDKGSKKESDFQVEREFPLMFANDRKARKQKGPTK